MFRLSAFVILPAAVFFICCSGNPVAETTAPVSDSTFVTVESYMIDSVATVDTLDLHFYIPVQAELSLETIRPLRSDSSVIFVCAAAFTRLDNGRIDGLFVERGNIITRAVNHTLGGGIIIPPPGSPELPSISGTDMGKKLDSAFVDSLVQTKSSFFQQIQMVRDGQALVFRKDRSRFQRRVICTWKGRSVIVENRLPCTLQKFADVLKSCGIVNALYLDMGSWDEGWFRDQHFTLHVLGLMRNQTDRQSNWLAFRAKR